MLFIDNRGITDPTINLALEEFVLKQLPMTDSYLLFYINEPSIIIGKNQNTIEEINADYVEERGIHVVRRLSGGGAVYHDTGNLNFSFLTKDDGQSFHNFRKFTQPIIDALQSFGVNAALTGRNDIQIGERKVSGNAMFATRGRLFSHGTLLFQSEMDHVASALKVKPIKVASKATKSVRSRVANITEFLHQPMTIEQFRAELLKHIFGTEVSQVPQYALTEADWQAVHELAESRYRNWEWNYGRSPKCNIQNAYKFPAGILDVRLDVEDGLITSLRIFGDYFGVGDVAEVEQQLKGTRYEEASLAAALASIDTAHYFGNVTQQQLIDLLLLREQPEVNAN
ncbi:lipoyltransferase and lipoate-protein ligase [Paenibacillus curdlanolyticus YK9]|uniref:lipoate--protein ligase n=1 Tax=Paenibacillus curdlanolyticus YK9 TaxID=717606 RepID=E0IFT7_9BACL|nr:lipoate--protein ligase [Paenibacillus curdlanolyticus]EFM08648.1 lipoyltransferase and lipoate-protein ligase [Paenibacillus curdlanolyticus YK9]